MGATSASSRTCAASTARRRLRDEPPLHGPDRHRWTTHRHLRHDRLAGEEVRRRTAASGSSASPTTAPAAHGLVNPHRRSRSRCDEPMVDGWIGDDWFHNGAFRQQMMAYVQDQEATASRRSSGGRATTTSTTCSCSGLGGELGRRRGLEQVGFCGSSSRTRATTRSGATRRWTRSWPPAAEGAGDAGPRLWTRRHLRGDRRLPRARAEGHGQRQGFLVMGPESRPADLDAALSAPCVLFGPVSRSAGILRPSWTAT